MPNMPPLSPNTADSPEWPKMWWDAELVAPETFVKGRQCAFVAVATDDAGVATTEQCTTVLSIYNCGPQCHSHDRSHPVSVDELLG